MRRGRPNWQTSKTMALELQIGPQATSTATRSLPEAAPQVDPWAKIWSHLSLSSSSSTGYTTREGVAEGNLQPSGSMRPAGEVSAFVGSPDIPYNLPLFPIQRASTCSGKIVGEKAEERLKFSVPLHSLEFPLAPRFSLLSRIWSTTSSFIHISLHCFIHPCLCLEYPTSLQP